MPKNKNAFIRYRIIDSTLRNRQKKYPSKKELIEACSGLGTVSARTIDKDIYDMKFDEELGYDAPIEYNRKYNGYYYSEAEYSINKIPLRQEDLYALEFACSLLKQFEGIEPVKQFIQSVGKIEEFINMKKIAGEKLDDIIQTEKGTGFAGNEYLGKMLTAILERKVVMIHYRRYDREQVKSYTYHPYVLKEYRNRWYVTGRAPTEGRIITFALERIKAMIPADENFIPDPAFKVSDYFKYSFGISVLSGFKPVEIKLSFHASEAPYLKSQPLHNTQKIIRENDREFVISLHLIPTYELKAQIFSFGDKVKVLSPPSLREEMLVTLKKAIQQYN